MFRIFQRPKMPLFHCSMMGRGLSGGGARMSAKTDFAGGTFDLEETSGVWTCFFSNTLCAKDSFSLSWNSDAIR